jgi:hypothetical protein
MHVSMTGKLASASGDRSCTATRSIDSTASGFLVGGTCRLPFICSGFFALTYVLILLGSAQAQSVITIGETSVLSAGDNDNSDLLLAQSAALAQAATIQSLSFYVTAAEVNGAYGEFGDPDQIAARVPEEGPKAATSFLRLSDRIFETLARVEPHGKHLRLLPSTTSARSSPSQMTFKPKPAVEKT